MTAKPFGTAMRTADVLQVARELGRNGHQAVDDDTPLLLPAEPKWPDDIDTWAYYGLAGDIVRLILPHTEADPVALLVNFLVAFGNAANRSAYFVADGARHYMNENAALVGPTSKGRKGTSWAQIETLMRAIDPAWADNIASGLVSGEGVIYHVRDETRAGDEITDPGVRDKRLMVVESEFAGILRVVARDGNTLSPILRIGWDTGNLRSLSKNSPLKATGAHLSILGHVSRDETLKYLGDVEISNGLANRFLWAAVRRSKVLPEGGEKVDWVGHGIIERAHQALQAAYSMGEMVRDDAARYEWAQVYPELSEGKLGLVGSATARGEAHVLRLSMIYAALDSSPVIQWEHLQAGLAVWNYCYQSAEYIFGASSGNPMADAILAELKAHPDGMTRTEIRKLLGTHAQKGDIENALALLAKTGAATHEELQTGGKPKQIWRTRP